MKNKLIAVTGGAGYIGSHTVLSLIDAGYDVLIIDNLYNSFEFTVNKQAIFEQIDILDYEALNKVLKKYKPDAIIHFAALVVVSDSFNQIYNYFLNNVMGTLNILNSMCDNGIDNIIFSSTAAVYGLNNKSNNKISEESYLNPISPYGSSKMIAEQMIRDFSIAKNINHIILRYFNVAGADLQLRTGLMPKKIPTHLIKVVAQTVVNKNDKLKIFGKDYNTKDGTCVRDYIHVMDLANIHVSAMENLFKHKKSDTFNCGYGKGYSILEVIEATEKIIGKSLNKEFADKRAGDPDVLVSDVSKLNKTLGFIPKYNDLELIIKTAIDWEKYITDKVNY